MDVRDGFPAVPRAQEYFRKVESRFTLLDEVICGVGQRDSLPRDSDRPSWMRGADEHQRLDRDAAKPISASPR